jgi:hypothetical protein
MTPAVAPVAAEEKNLAEEFRSTLHALAFVCQDIQRRLDAEPAHRVDLNADAALTDDSRAA